MTAVGARGEGVKLPDAVPRGLEFKPKRDVLLVKFPRLLVHDVVLREHRLHVTGASVAATFASVNDPRWPHFVRYQPAEDANT
jgi:hypothetical protein